MEDVRLSRWQSPRQREQGMRFREKSGERRQVGLPKHLSSERRMDAGFAFEGTFKNRVVPACAGTTNF